MAAPPKNGKVARQVMLLLNAHEQRTVQRLAKKWAPVGYSSASAVAVLRRLIADAAQEKRDGLREVMRAINAESRLWDGDCAEPFPSLRKRIRELAEPEKQK